MSWRSRWLAAALILLAIVHRSALLAAASTTLGVVIDGPGSLNAQVQQLTAQAISELTVGEFDVRFPSEKVLVSDWTREGVRADFQRLIADPDVDIVLAMGVIASFEAIGHGPLPKPVVAPFVVNYSGEPLPLEAGGSGVQNLSYLVLPRTFQRDVDTFVSVLDFTDLQKLAVLFSARLVMALPFLTTHVEGVLDDMGFVHQTLLVGEDPRDAVAAIDDDVDAVLVMPLIDQSREHMRELAEGLIQRRLPSFALLGRTDVENGLLAALNPDIFPRIARRIGLNVQSILLGDTPSTLPVAFAAGERLTINMATADAMGLPLRWATVTEADLVGEATLDQGPQLTLVQAVRQALGANRELAAATAQVAADAERVSRARSRLWPQVDLGLAGVWIDEDRAASSFGTQAERTLSGSAQVTQLLWSEQAWANLGIESEQQSAREAELRGRRMDVVQEAATAYLNVLRAQSLERIQKDNLKLTRSNLELAQVREMVGQSGPGETLRFQSQLASNVSSAIDANARRNVAEIELNRVLHHSLEAPFQTAESTLDDVLAALRADQVTYYFGSKRSFAVFRDFLVEEAMQDSPELLALDRAIAAQERALRSARRSFWSPTLALQGEAVRRFEQAGAGTDPPALPGLNAPDDTDWNVALALTFPLFEGGGKLALRRQATAQRIQLERQREQVAERIAQRTRTALHLVGASFAGIEQAQRASEAAHRSLELVVDAYAQGAVSILDLLDAQTTALVSDEREAAAVFDFFIDLMEVYRSIGAIESMLDDETREALLDRADAYFVARGLQPRQ
jgi:outer membrane protein TolC